MSEFNKDELEPPSWINKTFFEQVLSGSEGDSEIKVLSIDISPATAKGDHYASIMFRVRVTYDSKSSRGNCTSVILKTMPEEDCHKNEMFGEIPMFQTEIDMYSRIIPKFERELRKIGDNTVLGSKMLYHSLKPRKCIIFEDLVERGYNAVRGRLLNLTEAKAAFLKLAKWHAVSYKLAAEGDAPVTNSKSCVFDHFDSMPMMKWGLPNLIKTIDSIDELKTCAQKLKELPKDYLKRFTSGIDGAESQMNSVFVRVLCHADFHSKNMMFKNKANEPDDVMLIDFQVCFFGPAVMDLLYGLYLLVDAEIRMNHREELIYFYASNFINTLKRMNFQGKCPNISHFYIDILRARHWELFILCSLVPMLYVMIDGSMEVEELLKSEEGYSKIYSNPIYISEIKAVLPKLYYKGYFE